MTTALIHAVTTLPAALDRTDGSAFGMKKAMALIALVAVVVLGVFYLVDRVRVRRHPPTTPAYPILEPPQGRLGDPAKGPQR